MTTTVTVSNYDETGRIGVVQTVDDQLLSFVEPYVMGRYDTNVTYVVNGEAVPRPLNPTLLTGTTLYNVPLPAVVRIHLPKGEEDFEATDSTVELDFPIPGSYPVSVLCFPYTDAEFNVVAA